MVSVQQARPVGETRPRALIVDDDEPIRAALADIFAEDGFDILTAANGVEAIDRLRRGPLPDVIVLDLMMPVMDGWTFRVQQRVEPTFADIPVLAISADGSPKAAAIHADAYLAKPFSLGDVLREARRIMAVNEARRVRQRLARVERLAIVGTMVAGVGHEINNPLTYVVANLDELCDRVLPQARIDAPLSILDEATQLAHGARDGAVRIRRIANGLRAAVRAPDARRAPVQLARVMDLAIEVAQGHVRPRARIVRAYASVPPVPADEAQLVQVALNLIVNAADAFATPDPVRNEITAFVAPMANGMSFGVSDNGPGLSSQAQQHLFEPFFTTKAETGTGLGLAICRDLVEAHGGRIELDNRPGQGATFRVVLPVDRDLTPPPVSVATQAKRPMQRPRILVVDDERGILAAIRRILSDCDVTTEHDPAAALARLNAGERYDVVLCDLVMPKLTGLDLYEHALREGHPDQAARFVFLTGGAAIPGGSERVAASQRPVLHKPFRLEELRDAVDRVLGTS